MMKAQQGGIAVLVSVCLCLAASAEAKTNYFNGDGALVMKSVRSTPKIYQLFNTSSQPLLLAMTNKSSGAQAGYTTSLDPHNAAAFVYSGAKPPLVWVCQIPAKAPAVAQNIACDKVLSVKNYPTKSLTLKSADGNYWLVENKPAVSFKETLKAALVNKK